MTLSSCECRKIGAFQKSLLCDIRREQKPLETPVACCLILPEYPMVWKGHLRLGNPVWAIFPLTQLRMDACRRTTRRNLMNSWPSTPHGFRSGGGVSNPKDNIDLETATSAISARVTMAFRHSRIHNCLVPEALGIMFPLRQSRRELPAPHEAAGIPLYQAVFASAAVHPAKPASSWGRGPAVQHDNAGRRPYCPARAHYRRATRHVAINPIYSIRPWDPAVIGEARSSRR